MSEHEAEAMAESFPPGAADQKERSEGAEGADPNDALSRREDPDGDAGADERPTYPGGDERAKLRGAGGDDTSRALGE